MSSLPRDEGQSMSRTHNKSGTSGTHTRDHRCSLMDVPVELNGATTPLRTLICLRSVRLPLLSLAARNFRKDGQRDWGA